MWRRTRRGGINHELRNKTLYTSNALTLFKCLICSFSTYSSASISSHRRFCKAELGHPELQNDTIYIWDRNKWARDSKTIKHPIRREYHSNIKTTFECQLCDFTARETNALSRHLVKEHIKKNDRKRPAQHFRCPFCPAFFPYKSACWEHKIDKHSQTELYCNHCQFYAKYRIRFKTSSMKRHFHRKGLLYRCEYCNFYASKCETSLGQHQIDKHQLVHWLECNYWFCEYRTKSENDFQQHLKKTHGENTKWRQCPYCNYSCKERLKWQKHLKIHFHDYDYDTVEKTKKKIEKTDSPQKAHFRLTLKDYINWFRCNNCDYLGLTKCDLDQHCSNCTGRAAASVQRTTINHWFYCDLCPFSTRSKKEFEKHQVSPHPLETTAQNTAASSSSTKRDSKSRHLVVRSKNMQSKMVENSGPDEIVLEEDHELYHCHHCKFRTKNKAKMEEHLALLNEVGWLKCEQCVYRTKRKKKLEAHRALPHGEPKVKQKRNPKKPKNDVTGTLRVVPKAKPKKLKKELPGTSLEEPKAKPMKKPKKQNKDKLMDR